MKKFDVTLYTDGSCLRNGDKNARGGWAAILTCKGKEKELSGATSGTKSNRMEMTAVIEGLSALKVPCKVTVVTDSKYVCNCATESEGWKSMGWKTKSGSTPANIDLIERLHEVSQKHEVIYQHIPGHKGHTYNERCDALARRCANSIQKAEQPEQSIQDAVAILTQRIKEIQND